MVDELGDSRCATKSDAEAIATQYLDAMCVKDGRLIGDLAVDKELIEEFDIGWVFYWSTARYWQTGAMEDAIAGNAPLLIRRGTGEVIALGTGRPTIYYVDWIRRHGEASWR
ncbi:MAG: YrhB domain-containing protein [Phycisphaerales bacterium]